MSLQKRSDIHTLKRVRVDKEANSLVLFSSWHSSEGDLDRNIEGLRLSNDSDIMHSCVKR